MNKNNLKNVFKYHLPVVSEVINSVFNASTFSVILRREQSELSGESRNITSLFLKEAKYIASRLFSVITGFIPVILVQRITNLVNKLAILFKRSLFRQDCRNASGNDGKRRGFSICCKLFKYPSPDTNVSTSPAGGEVLNNDLHKGLNVVCQYASKLLETAESGVDKVVSSCEKNPSVHLRYMNFLRQRKTALDAPLHAVSSGRSMIEMLGVLAIIGVLSVGGIAGYSKAMQKFKHDKWLQQVETLIFNIKDAYKNEHQYGKYNENILPTLKSINIVPQDMLDENNMDLFGNRVSVSMRPWNNYTRMNLKFQMLANHDAIQNCHDLLHFVPLYTNYLWVAGVCAGNNCDGPYFYRICGKAAPSNYIPIDTCREYDLIKVMNACEICEKQSCSVLLLFDNNA